MSQRLPNFNYLTPELRQGLGDLELVAREVVQGLRSGAHRSNLLGFSTEFAHHRQYVPGDSIRNLDWRLFSRTDRYYTKLYEAETNFDCYLLFDSSASMTYGSGAVSKLEYAKFLAASMAYMILKQRDSIGLSVFDSKVRSYFPPRSSMNIILEIDHILRDTEPLPKTSIAQQLDNIALMMKRRSIVILISDLFADTADILRGLDRLRFSGHSVIVLHTLDPYEINFPFKGTWRFNDLEADDRLITQPERIKEDYLNSFNSYLETVKNGCIANNIEYSMIDTSRPVDLVLSELINSRELR
ncbi:MAG: hypothetical protein ACI8W8_000527 [Rhodothermales bacterium]|jgi:uncharacterized protein (DUF58 family)